MWFKKTHLSRSRNGVSINPPYPCPPFRVKVRSGKMDYLTDVAYEWTTFYMFLGIINKDFSLGWNLDLRGSLNYYRLNSFKIR
jgi:hypothetical protein